MAQAARQTKEYNGQTAFSSGAPSVNDWNVDFDAIFSTYNAHDLASTGVHGGGTIAKLEDDQIWSGDQTFTGGHGSHDVLIVTTLEASGGIDAGASGIFLKTKVIEIGDWNMDSTPGLSVTHGVNLDNIRMVSCVIRIDGGTALYSFPLPDPSATNREAIAAGVTDITLSRADGGFFDSTSFNATSFNRGYIVIDYVA